MLKKTTLQFLLWSVALSSAASAGQPQQQKASDDLKAANPSTAMNIIVRWKSAPTQTLHQKVTSRGGSFRQVFSQTSAASYQLTAGQALDLANDPDVDYIAPDRPLKAKLDYSSVAVNAPQVILAGYTGAGIGVAVLDSGMVASADLTVGNKIVYSQDFTGESSSSGSINVLDTNNAKDNFGHGQHVAGIIASSGASTVVCANCTRKLVGIAPGVSLINLKVLDKNGNGTDSMVIAAIETAIKLKNVYNIRVMNLSLGRPYYESYKQDPLCQAVEAAWKAGIVVVVAAGNDGRDNSMGTNGYGTIEAPGNDPYVITVGAMKTMQTMTRTDDMIASYSSKGPSAIDSIVKPDIVAPGNQVVSLLASSSDTLATQYKSNNVPRSYYQETNSGASTSPYFTLSGTSMATPVVSAAVADLLQAQPTLKPDQVKARLMLTANKSFPKSSTAVDPTSGATFVSYYDVFTVGAGYLDIAAAIANKTVATGTAMSPVASYNASTDSISITPDASATWSATSTTAPYAIPAVWGNTNLSASRSVWGATTVSSSRSVWGNSSDSALRSVWGADSVSASRSVWGADTVSSTRAVWGQTAAVGDNTVSAKSADVTITGEQ